MLSVQFGAVHSGPAGVSFSDVSKIPGKAQGDSEPDPLDRAHGVPIHLSVALSIGTDEKQWPGIVLGMISFIEKGDFQPIGNLPFCIRIGKSTWFAVFRKSSQTREGRRVRSSAIQSFNIFQGIILHSLREFKSRFGYLFGFLCNLIQKSDTFGQRSTGAKCNFRNHWPSFSPSATLGEYYGSIRGKTGLPGCSTTEQGRPNAPSIFASKCSKSA